MARRLRPLKMAPGKPFEARLQLRVGLEQGLVLQVHVLDRGLGALVGVVELLEGLVVVLRGQELPALDPKVFEISRVFWVTLV